jgi:hypothetical protein
MRCRKITHASSLKPLSFSGASAPSHRLDRNISHISVRIARFAQSAAALTMDNYQTPGLSHILPFHSSLKRFA